MNSFLVKTYSLFIVLIVSCSATVQSIKPIAENPTNYTYQANILAVKEAIKKEFLQLPGYRYMRLEYTGRDIIISEKAKKLLQDKSNANDFYLSYSGSIGKSKVYVDKKGVSLDYYAEFHLHLTETGNQHTKVEVFTIEPKVAVGRELLPSLPHLARVVKTKDVNPTTLEEYEILQRIGNAVGEKGMPILKTPLPQKI